MSTKPNASRRWWELTLPPAWTDWSADAPLDRRRALYVALAIALVSGVVTWMFFSRQDAPSDFFHYWSATRTMLAGRDPYLVIPDGPANSWRDVNLYPLPTLLLMAPFALLPLPIAGGTFIGVSSGLAAWAIARTGASRLPLFLSPAFILCVSLGQWSPLLVAAALMPVLGFVVCAKPTTGLASFVAQPTMRTVLALSALLAVSLIVLPRWPLEWLANVSSREEKFIPLLRPGGFVLLSALVAWRRPEGRLFAAMALVPQNLFYYDQLALWLVPRTLRQSLLLSIYSFVVYLTWWRVVARGDTDYMRQAVPYAYALYFPALAILLWNWWRDRRPSSAMYTP